MTKAIGRGSNYLRVRPSLALSLGKFHWCRFHGFRWGKGL